MRAIVLLLATSWYGSTQSTDTSLTFEVASVKVTSAAQSAGGMVTARKSSSGPGPGAADPIRFSRRRATLASLLLAAYSLKPQQLIGPDWLTSERYDVEAKVPDGATGEQQLIMLQNLLVERFRMKVHRETKEMPVYEMVIAKGGPKLKEPGTGAYALPVLRPGGPLQLGFKDGMTTIVLREQGTLEALAARLSGQAGRPIVDRTGLKGNYDFDMSWMPAPESSPAEGAASGAATASDPGGSLLAAFESQLGLKLVPKKGMVEVLVVDRAEKVPTDN
jgi:uncharacterized protein (TIGR03435 family)